MVAQPLQLEESPWRPTPPTGAPSAPPPAATPAPRTPSAASDPSALSDPSPPPLPPLSPQDRPLLLRLIALSENYHALAAELAATDHALAAHLSAQTAAREGSPLSTQHSAPSTPKDILDLYAWATRPDIAPWIAFHRSMTDLQRRTLALDTLQSVIKSTDSPTERRRAATTLLSQSRRGDRALSGRWPRATSSIQNPQSKIQNLRTAPPPRSVPIPSEDPTPALESIREALSTPQSSIALSTLHAHSAENAFFARHPIPKDPAAWLAELPKQLPAGFRFPLTFVTGPTEIEHTPQHFRCTLSLLNLARDRFRCTLTLIRDGPNHPAPCWRLAAFDILQHNTG